MIIYYSFNKHIDVHNKGVQLVVGTTEVAREQYNIVGDRFPVGKCQSNYIYDIFSFISHYIIWPYDRNVITAATAFSSLDLTWYYYIYYYYNVQASTRAL